jgi:hypothetical protein
MAIETFQTKFFCLLKGCLASSQTTSPPTKKAKNHHKPARVLPCIKHQRNLIFFSPGVLFGCSKGRHQVWRTDSTWYTLKIFCCCLRSNQVGTTKIVWLIKYAGSNMWPWLSNKDNWFHSWCCRGTSYLQGRHQSHLARSCSIFKFPWLQQPHQMWRLCSM